MKMTFSKQGIRILCLVCCIALGMMLFPAPAQAAPDVVQTLAFQLYQAVELGQSQIHLRVETKDLNSVLDAVFSRYPTLYIYYDGYSSMIYPTYTEADFKLKNLDVDWDSVYIAQDLEDVRSIVAYHVSRMESGFRFVTPNAPEVTAQQLQDFAYDMKQDHYLAFMGYSTNQMSYLYSDTLPLRCYDVDLMYWEGVPEQTLAQWRDQTEQKALELAGSLFAQDMPDYMKELRIHDWLVNHNRYNTQDTSAAESHMAYSALVSGKPVCQGYAEACLVLFQAAGIPVTYVAGDGYDSEGNGGSHAWNCVQIQGNWYNLDVTWDDPINPDGSDSIRYDYFNVTDSQLGQDHTWDRSTAPQCNATIMNYDQVRALVDSDYSYYTDYSSRNVMTRAKTGAQYGADLRVCVKPEDPTPPATQPTTPVPTLPETLPTATEPVGETIPVHIPEYTIEESIEDTQGYTYPPYDPRDPEEEPQETGSVFVLIWIFLGLVGLGVILFLIIKKAKGKPRPPQQPTYFDPTNMGF